MVYCFDLDGTLCNTDGNNYKDSTPKKDRIKIVNALYEEGHAIRDAVNESLKSKVVTKDLASNGEKFYKTNEVGEWICQKI